MVFIAQCDLCVLPIIQCLMLRHTMNFVRALTMLSSEASAPGVNGRHCGSEVVSLMPFCAAEPCLSVMSSCKIRGISWHDPPSS